MEPQRGGALNREWIGLVMDLNVGCVMLRDEKMQQLLTLMRLEDLNGPGNKIMRRCPVSR